MIPRHSRRAILAGLALPLVAPRAHANQAYPDKVVRLILPYAAGGPSDLVARLLGEGLERRLKQPFVVDYRPGASSNIGTVATARATPDGYTLLVGSNVMMINFALFHNPGFDPVRDFAPICGLAAAPNLFVAAPQSGIRSLQDLIAMEKAKPGSLNYSSPGAGTPNHILFESLQNRIGSKIVHVPFQGGGAPATQAVLAGTTQLGVLLLPNVLEHIKAGSLNAIAASGDARIADLPDVPTLKELGHDTQIEGTFYFLVAPRGLPEDVTSRLAQETASAFAEETTKSRLRQLGMVALTMPPDQLATYVRTKTDTYRELISAAGLERR